MSSIFIHPVPKVQWQKLWDPIAQKRGEVFYGNMLCVIKNSFLPHHADYGVGRAFAELCTKTFSIVGNALAPKKISIIHLFSTYGTFCQNGWGAPLHNLFFKAGTLWLHQRNELPHSTFPTSKKSYLALYTHLHCTSTYDLPPWIKSPPLSPPWLPPPPSPPHLKCPKSARGRGEV